MAVYDFRQTKVYQKGFSLAMEVFELTKSFPVEERYSMTDQIRRSSRSVCICLTEAHRKKKHYPAYFVSKVPHADMENSETLGWLHFAVACKYITTEKFEQLKLQNEEIGRLLNHMIENPDKY